MVGTPFYGAAGQHPPNLEAMPLALHPTPPTPQPLDLTSIDDQLPAPLPGLAAGCTSKMDLLSALNPELSPTTLEVVGLGRI